MISRTFTLICAFTALALPTFAQKVIRINNNINIQFDELPPGNGKLAALNLPQSDPSGTDILRFLNGDLMHGEFAGIKKGVLWSRPDLQRNISFDFKNLRQIIFKGAKSSATEAVSPFVSLANGDVIPGEIISLDDKSLILESSIAGRLTIPREQIKSFTPNPFDGQLLYAGPFTSDHWLIIEQKEANAPDIEADAEAPENEPAEEEPEKPASWIYSGASLYSTNTRPIAIDAKLPDVGRLRFKLAWRNRLSANLAFHADFTRPLPREIIEPEEPPAEEKEAEEKKEPTEKDAPEGEEIAEEQPEEKKPPKYKPLEYESLLDLPKGDALQSLGWLPANSSASFLQTYGSSYILSFNSSYVTLHYCTYDADGKAIQQSRRSSRITTANFSESDEAEFDLRFDRNKKAIYLYINGQYGTQWSEIDGYAGKGSAIGFAASGNSRLKISDIIVSSWSGTPDTASSLEHDERDIALLINGTDRFSGKVTAIADGKITLKSPYAEMSIPLTELSQIQLHRSGIATDEDAVWPERSGILVFNPIGRLTIQPTSADKKSITAKSPILGDLKIDLKNATLLQFAEHPEALSDWVTDF